MTTADVVTTWAESHVLLIAIIAAGLGAASVVMAIWAGVQRRLERRARIRYIPVPRPEVAEKLAPYGDLGLALSRINADPFMTPTEKEEARRAARATWSNR